MSKKVEGPHEDITYRIIGAAMAVHRRLGPEHKEEVYQRALEAEFEKAGLSFEAQKNLEVYDEGRLVGYYIPDFILESKVIVEIKAFATLHQKYLGQVITYLNHTGLAVGLLINFGERSLRPRRVFPSPQAVGSGSTANGCLSRTGSRPSAIHPCNPWEIRKVLFSQSSSVPG